MTIDEIAPEVYRLSLYIPEADLRFNQFLVRDDEPLLFHTGMKAIFPFVHEAVSKVIDPATLRWIGFSHFEADECGSLNQWLDAAPKSEAMCSVVGAMVSVNDFASRPARALEDGETVETGKYRFRFVRTPHLPHCWEAGVLFEETNGTLFCSDLFHQGGDVKAFTDSDVMDAVRETLVSYQASPLADYMPYNRKTSENLRKLAALNARTIAPMHGSSFAGDTVRAFENLDTVMREVLG